jgi:WD40 repeat protein
VAEGAAGRRARCKGCGQVFGVDRASIKSTASGGAAVDTAAESPRAGTAEVTQVGRFPIRARLGSGAFGTVYRAYDPQLDREVALKVPHPGTLDTPQRVERFLREARSAARLRHPHIVPVFDAGRDGNHYYIASAFIPGKPLGDAVVGNGLDPRRAARITRELAEAVAYAHGQGIIHRDLKPANVILDSADHPHLLDFGLAARQDESEKLTRDGAVLGTPAYMAPEQAAGQQGDARPAGDQYSLGVLLYELLTGRTPFEGPPATVLYNAIHSEPPRPRSLRPSLPGDLETICLKAMSKQAGDRYVDCQALADDLRRFLDGEPIAARRLGLAERLLRWCKREPVLAVAGVVVALCVLVVMVVLVGSGLRQGYLANVATEEALQAQKERDRASDEADKARQQRDRADKEADKVRQERDRADRALQDAIKERNLANQQLLRAETARYALEYHQAWRDWEENRPGRALEVLDACRLDFRSWEHHFLRALCNRKQQVLVHDQPEVRCAACSADGRLVATGGSVNPGMGPRPGGDVKVRELQTGKVVFQQHGLQGMVRVVALSADGQRLFTVSHDYQLNRPQAKLQVWDVSAGKEVRSWPVEGGQAAALALTPDGGRVAVGLLALNAKGLVAGGEIHVWEIDGKPAWSRTALEAAVTALAFDPQGQWLASANKDGMVRLWATTAGKAGPTFKASESSVCSLCLSADGKYLAAGAIQGEAKVWDHAQGKEVLHLTSTVGFDPCVAFHGSSKLLATGSASGLKLWDLRTGQMSAVQECRQPVYCLSFPGEGNNLVAVGPSSVSAWPQDLVQEYATLRGPEGPIHGLALSPDANWLAALGVSPKSVVEVYVFDAATSKPRFKVQGSGPINLALGISRDGRQFAWSSEPHILKLWSIPDGKQLHVCKHRGYVSSVAYSPVDDRLASAGTVSGSRVGEVRLWDTTTGQQLSTFEVPEADGYCALAFSPDGKVLATGASDKHVRLWDAATGKELRSAATTQFMFKGMAFSPDGKWLAAWSHDHAVTVWNRDTLDEVLSLHLGTRELSVTFSQDSRRLLAGASAEVRGQSGLVGKILVVDIRTGQQLLDLPTHTGQVHSLAASADGTRLATGSADGTVKLWDASRRQQIMPVPILFEPGASAFSGDGQRFAIGVGAAWIKGTVGHVAVYDTATAKLINRYAENQGAIQAVALSPDGQRLAYGVQGKVLVVEAASGKVIKEMTGPKGLITSIGFGPQGTLLAAASAEGGLGLWELGTGKRLLELERVAIRLAFTPDGKQLIATGAGAIKVWEAATGKELPGIVDTGPFAGEMAIAGDGQTLLTLGNDGKARVWDLRGRKLVRTHDGLGGIRALAITPDGRHVVTAGSQLVVWHAGTGKLVRKLDDSHGPFTTLALSPDGRFLFAAVSSRQAWLWDLSWLEQGSLP